MMYCYIATAVAALVTFGIRVFPYVVLSNRTELPLVVQYLSSQLPKAIMIVLVVYCIKDISFNATPYGIPEFLGIILVGILHKWKHNTLLSIFLPTLVYMILIQNFS